MEVNKSKLPIFVNPRNPCRDEQDLKISITMKKLFEHLFNTRKSLSVKGSRTVLSRQDSTGDTLFPIPEHIPKSNT